MDIDLISFSPTVLRQTVDHHRSPSSHPPLLILSPAPSPTRTRSRVPFSASPSRRTANKLGHTTASTRPSLRASRQTTPQLSRDTSGNSLSPDHQLTSSSPRINPDYERTNKTNLLSPQRPSTHHSSDDDETRSKRPILSPAKLISSQPPPLFHLAPRKTQKSSFSHQLLKPISTQVSSHQLLANPSDPTPSTSSTLTANSNHPQTSDSIDESEPILPHSKFRVIRAATPPKPRKWDEENSFQAFEVEDFNLDVDLTITCESHDHLDDQVDQNKNRIDQGIQPLSSSKLTLAHVEMVMSDLDNSLLSHYNSRRRSRKLKVRYSTEGLLNHHDIDELAQQARPTGQDQAPDKCEQTRSDDAREEGQRQNEELNTTEAQEEAIWRKRLEQAKSWSEETDSHYQESNAELDPETDVNCLRATEMAESDVQQSKPVTPQFDSNYEHLHGHHAAKSHDKPAAMPSTNASKHIDFVSRSPHTRSLALNDKQTELNSSLTNQNLPLSSQGPQGGHSNAKCATQSPHSSMDARQSDDYNESLRSHSPPLIRTPDLCKPHTNQGVFNPSTAQVQEVSRDITSTEVVITKNSHTLIRLIPNRSTPETFQTVDAPKPHLQDPCAQAEQLRGKTLNLNPPDHDLISVRSTPQPLERSPTVIEIDSSSESDSSSASEEAVQKPLIVIEDDDEHEENLQERTDCSGSSYEDEDAAEDPRKSTDPGGFIRESEELNQVERSQEQRELQRSPPSKSNLVHQPSSVLSEVSTHESEQDDSDQDTLGDEAARYVESDSHTGDDMPSAFSEENQKAHSKSLEELDHPVSKQNFVSGKPFSIELEHGNLAQSSDTSGDDRASTTQIPKRTLAVGTNKTREGLSPVDSEPNSNISEAVQDFPDPTRESSHLKHLTSTPRVVSSRPSPFPEALPLTKTRKSIVQSPTRPLIEISSADPKVAARAAAILKVHHGFIPRGCKAEQRGLMDDDELELEMEMSIRREEARAVEHSVHQFEREGTHDSNRLLRQVHLRNQRNTLPDEPQRYSSMSLAVQAEDASTNITMNSTCDPDSTTMAESVAERKIKKKTLKEELQEINYKPQADRWTTIDWKILESCVRKTRRSWERRSSFGDEVDAGDVVMKMLRILKMGVADCQKEWEWSKMIHRVIALQLRISNSNNQSRTRESSLLTESNEEGDQEDDIRYLKATDKKTRISRSPSSDHIQMKSESNQQQQQQQQQKKHIKIPIAPIRCSKFDQQCIENVKKYKSKKIKRKIGSGTIWEIIDKFEDQIEIRQIELNPMLNKKRFRDLNELDKIDKRVKLK